MLSTRRLSALERRHIQHVEGLADALVWVRDEVLKHVPDDQLRRMMDDALGFTDGAQWYAYLRHDCGVPVELVERLKRADDALIPFTQSAAYKAWETRHLARINAEIARLNAQDAP